MHITTLTELIENKMKQLGKGRAELSRRANEKATSLGEYEKKIGITTMQLRNGVTMNLEGIEIVNPPATSIDKIARGICYKEKITAELREAEYKNAIVGMSALQAELSALQSIFRYQETT